MPKRQLPTPAELAILQQLWRLGPTTVRDVHAALAAGPGGSGIGYTTVLKLLQIMKDKGLVRRDESARSHVYRAAVAEAPMQGRLLADLAARAFGGSTVELALRALDVERASSEDLARARAWLDEAERASRAFDGEDAS